MTPLPSHGGQLRRLSEHHGIGVSELLDFSANINPDGPPQAVLSALHTALSDLSVLTNYPDLAQTDLKASIGRFAAVFPDRIFVSNGFVPLLDAALRALSIRHCLLPVPAFNEYRRALERAQIKITPFLLSPQNGFRYNIHRLTTGDHDAVLLANSQNPSGVLCSHDSIIALITQARSRNMYVLLDEAFIDYQPAYSAAAYIDHFPNLIIFRSLTKFYGIPGLRVAYAMASAQNTIAIEGNLAPWPITNLVPPAIAAALGDSAYAENTRELNERRRRNLEVALNDLGMFTYLSAANFLLLRVPERIDEVIFWKRLLTEHHIVLRSCRDYETLPYGHLRVAVKTSTQNNRLIEAVATLMNECG